MRGWGRVWGRWEKTGGGGGIVRHLLVTATLGNCTMQLTLHQNDCTRVCACSSEKRMNVLEGCSFYLKPPLSADSFHVSQYHLWRFGEFIDADIDYIIATKRWDKSRDRDALHMSVEVFKSNNIEHNRMIACYVGTQTPSSLSSGSVRRQDFQI